MSEYSKPIDLAHSVFQIMDRLVDPSMKSARDSLSHLDATKEELWVAVAYLALQGLAYKRLSNLDAELAMQQIAGIVNAFQDRRTR